LLVQRRKRGEKNQKGRRAARSGACGRKPWSLVEDGAGKVQSKARRKDMVGRGDCGCREDSGKHRKSAGFEPRDQENGFG